MLLEILFPISFSLVFFLFHFPLSKSHDNNDDDDPTTATRKGVLAAAAALE